MFLNSILISKMSADVGRVKNLRYISNKVESIWDIPEDDKDELKPMAYYFDLDIKRHISPAKSFEELYLRDNIMKGLTQTSIFAPSQVQQYLLPLFLSQKKENEDLLIHAASKSGKTTSALIALLQILSSPGCNLSKAIMIYPTYERADEAIRSGQVIGKFSKTSLKLVVGKKENKTPNKIYEQLIIGTPQKIENIIKAKLLDIKDVVVIIVDDIQLMVEDKGHQNSLAQIFRSIMPSCYLVLMGSTPPTKFKPVLFKSYKKLRFYPLIIDFPVLQNNTSPIVKSYFATCGDIKIKKIYLLDIIEYRRAKQRQMIIICEERKTVNDLHSYLENIGLTVSSITGKLTLAKRGLIIQDFKDGKIEILITTRSFRDLKSPLLMTMVMFDLFRVEEGSTVKLDESVYQKWMKIMPNCKQSLIVNFVDEKYAEFVLKEVPKENILDKNKLIMLLSSP